jgi:DNA-binding transcriptional regulator YdaS (Cro superfamily)
MDLKTYIAAERGRATALASKLGISPSYLSQLANGQAPASPERCVEIWRATDGEVTRQDLRPDDWDRIWPELVDASPAQ